MNTELRKLAKDDFEKDLFKLMNNAVFGKTMENIRKHRDIKLVTTDKKRNKLVSEPNYRTIYYIAEDLSIIEMNKRKVKMHKPIYLGLSILDISKILMYEFWYDYIKPKYNDKVKLCYMGTDSFIMSIKTNDFYKDISIDVDKRFDTSNLKKSYEAPSTPPEILQDVRKRDDKARTFALSDDDDEMKKLAEITKDKLKLSRLEMPDVSIKPTEEIFSKIKRPEDFENINKYEDINLNLK